MIAYFDTSCLVPMLVAEPISTACLRLWAAAERVVSVPLLYVEGRAALARAHRLGRVDTRQLAAAVNGLEALVGEVDMIGVTLDLSRMAGELAQVHALRGYDAVHLAAATVRLDPELVFVTADQSLAAAATASGLAVSVPR